MPMTRAVAAGRIDLRDFHRFALGASADLDGDR